jgi:hypothetical protein
MAARWAALGARAVGRVARVAPGATAGRADA